MNFNDLNEVKLGAKFSFNSVSTQNISHLKIEDAESSEINVYAAKLDDLDNIDTFLASCLKVSYKELFEGEPEQDMVDAYDNLVSNYGIGLNRISNQLALRRLSVYQGVGIDYPIKMLSESLDTFELQGENDTFLVSNGVQVMLIECDYE